MKRKDLKKIIATGLFMTMISNYTPVKASENTLVNLRIGAISDLHANLMNFDYFTMKETNSGLVKIATLIQEAKTEVNKSNDSKIDNMLLFDNGDTIQGNSLGDYFNKVEVLEEGNVVYNALQELGFDVSNLGNHEFNYGLDFLDRAIKGTNNMSIINSNVLKPDGTPRFKQYEVIEEKVIDTDGKEQIVKVGVCGFVPTQILNWDKLKLKDEVIVEDIVKSANKMVKILKEDENVDIIIALAHSGYGDGEYVENKENVSYELSKIEGIDTIIAGHTHQQFPSNDENINSLTGVKSGKMNGVPTVMTGNGGKDLGIIDLTLKQVDGKWKVIKSKSELRSTNEKDNYNMSSSVIEQHNKTVEYVSSPIGEIDKDLHTFFTLVRDNEGVELVTKAQKDKVEQLLKDNASDTLNQYKNLPILSMASAFKAGKYAQQYVDIQKGNIAIKDVTNLYQYSNSFAVVKLTGAEIKEILEMTSSVYNTIDAQSSSKQELINSKFIPFNYSVIEGITYKIDVTKPCKYDENGVIVNEDSERIVDIMFEGKPLNLEKEFLLATDSYRAGGGGNYPSLSPDKVVYSTDEEVRQVVADYIKENKDIELTTDNNWSIKDIPSSIAEVVFTSSSRAMDYIHEYSGMEKTQDLENDLVEIKYDLTTRVISDREAEANEFVKLILSIVMISVTALGYLTIKKRKRR